MEMLSYSMLIFSHSFLQKSLEFVFRLDSFDAEWQLYNVYYASSHIAEASHSGASLTSCS